MTLYVIIICLAICLGMAISVWAFGTGGKRSRIFHDIYSLSRKRMASEWYIPKPAKSRLSLKMENPVAKFGGNIDAYYEYTKLFAAICATLGEDYAIHKQDIFTRKGFCRRGR